MNQRRDQATLTDYVLVGINPVLIGLLVGSLVFFLLEAFYQGQYDGRLRIIFALFVMAIVGVARISINEGGGHAILFAIPLALVTGLAMSKFVDYGGSLSAFKTFLNWGLMGVVWWAAHQLTWDCTVLDEAADASGQGLFQQLGWRRSSAAPTSAAPPGSTVEEPEGLTNHEERRDEYPTFWEGLRQRLLRKHTPGVWVVYFSLAALPIFGIGQRFIGAEDAAGERRAQLLLAVYVGAGLALLVTTSFLNLRRYLRKRHVDVGHQLTVNWLVVGAVLIAAVLAVSWILPGPRAARWADPIAISRNLNPSRWGLGSDGPQSKQGRKAAPSPDSKSPPQGSATGGAPDPNASTPGKSSGGQQSDGQQPGGNQDGSQSGQQQGSQADGPSQTGQTSDTPPPPDSNQGDQTPPDGAQPPPAQGAQPADGAPPPPSAADPNSADARRPPPAPPSQSPPPAEAGSGDARPPENQVAQQAESGNNESDSASSDGASGEAGEGATGSQLGRMAEATGEMFAWLIRIVAIVAMLAAAWYFRAEIWRALREFVQGLKDWLAGLSGRQKPATDAAAAAAASAATRPPPPAWREFSDPFVSGRAAQWGRGELIRYTFAALDAWARDCGLARQPQETPLEFARRLRLVDEQFSREAATVAEYYGQAAFARDSLPAASTAAAQQLWRRLTNPAPAAPAS